MKSFNVLPCARLARRSASGIQLSRSLPVSASMELLVFHLTPPAARSFASNPQHRVTFFAESQEYKKYCTILQVPEDADQEQVRQAYLTLAKKYHPDGGSSEASTSKFHEIDEAYKYLQKAFADFRHNRHKVEGEYGLYYKEKRQQEHEEEEDQRIKHVTPQHRQYLNYDGVGVGNPFQRQNAYQKHRAAKAAENLYDHRIGKLTQGTEETALTKNRREAKKGSTRYGFDRLVEDLIQESIAKGDFEGLSGAGKPLRHTAHGNPHVDFTTHKLNQVLIENGFTPEWILLEKEIRTDIREIRETLRLERHKYDKDMTDPSDRVKWAEFLAHASLKARVEDLNTRIAKYNLVVPILFKQIVSMNLEREARRVEKEWSQEVHDATVQATQELSESSHRAGVGVRPSSTSASTQTENSFLGFLVTIFTNTK